jgi:type I restriction enzyme R subunit
MQSQKFEFLRKRWPELASLGGFAEHYCHGDPQGALVKLRAFAEQTVAIVYQDLALPRPSKPAFIELMRNN